MTHLRRHVAAFAAVGLLAVSAAACSSGPSTPKTLPPTDSDVLACSSLAEAYHTIKRGGTVTRDLADQVVEFGQAATASSIRKATTQLRTDANEGNNVGVDNEILAFGSACATYGLGPTGPA